MKTLEVGKNYMFCFSQDEDCQLIYNGNDSWTGIQNGETETHDDHDLVVGALEYINRASSTMGSVRF